jgi:plasmid stabilization system protein ParE
MAKVVQTGLAREDTREILRWLRRHSRPAAIRLADELAARYRVLAQSPRIGSERPELRDDIRSLVVGDYVVIYHAADDR